LGGGHGPGRGDAALLALLTHLVGGVKLHLEFQGRILKIKKCARTLAAAPNMFDDSIPARRLAGRWIEWR